MEFLHTEHVGVELVHLPLADHVYLEVRLPRPLDLDDENLVHLCRGCGLQYEEEVQYVASLIVSEGEWLIRQLVHVDLVAE